MTTRQKKPLVPSRWGIIAFASVAAALLPSLGHAAQVMLNCPGTAQAGSQFATGVTIDVGTTPLGAYGITLTYDPTVVTIATVTGGTTPEFQTQPTSNTITPGTTNISGLQSMSLTSPTGIVSVASVTFNVIAATSTTATIGLTVRNLYDTGSNPILPATGTGCAVSVIGPATTTTSTSTTTTQVPTTTTSTSASTTTRPPTTTTSTTATTTTTRPPTTTTSTSTSTTTQAPTTTTSTTATTTTTRPPTTTSTTATTTTTRPPTTTTSTSTTTTTQAPTTTTSTTATTTTTRPPTTTTSTSTTTTTQAPSTTTSTTATTTTTRPPTTTTSTSATTRPPTTTTSSTSSTTVRPSSTTTTSFSATTTTICPCSPTPTAIGSNFNGTPIAAGNYIWFNSVLKPSGLGSGPVTIRFEGSTVTFTASNVTYTLNVPDAQITFDPAVTVATTSFNSATKTWETSTPPNVSGNTFLAGIAFQVPVNFPGGIAPVTWGGTLRSDTPGVTISWKWAAAVYRSFSADEGALNVKPVDDNDASAYKNSDHAGTPESFKTFVIGGARGGGGANFTGGYSGTASVKCQCVSVSSLSIQTTSGSRNTRARRRALGRITATGTVVTRLLADPLGASSGISLRLSDSRNLDETVVFAASDCETSRSGCIRCRTADRRLRAVFTPNGDRSTYSFTLTGPGLDVRGPIEPDISVFISTGAGQSIGVIAAGECRSSESAMRCRRSWFTEAPPEAADE